MPEHHDRRDQHADEHAPVRPQDREQPPDPALRLVGVDPDVGRLERGGRRRGDERRVRTIDDGRRVLQQCHAAAPAPSALVATYLLGFRTIRPYHLGR